MLVFEKVEGIIANCSNSYHFVIREIPLDGPEFHMLALELNGAAHYNQAAKPINWTYTVEKLEQKLGPYL